MIHLPRQTVLIAIGVSLLMVGAAAAVSTHRGKSPNSQHTASKQAATAKRATPNAPAAIADTSAKAAADSSSKSSVSKGTSTPTSVTGACKLLTLSIAQQVLDGNAKASTTSDTSALQTPSTSLNACAYASGSNSAQLVIRTPKNALGVSENDLVFGSERPANAVTVQGYGQAAYWDPGKQQLNVLGSNNWYIITRSTNTQADAEAVAKLLVAGF